MDHHATLPADRIPVHQKLVYGLGAFVNNLLAAASGGMMIVLNLGLGMNPALVGLLGSLFIRGDLGRMTGALLALVGFGVSAFLTIWSITTLETTCRWCLASAATMTLLAIFTVIRLLRAPSR